MMLGQIDWVMTTSVGANVALMLTVVLMWKLRDTGRREISPQPLEVKFAQEFASRMEFVKLLDKNEREHATFDRRIDGLDRTMREHIDKKLTEMQASAEEGRGKLHGRIDDILEAVSELRGEMRAKRGI